MNGRMYADSDRIKHFRAEGAAQDDEAAYVEVRYEKELDEDGVQTVDEIVTTNLHLEMMNVDSCWMEIHGLHVWFRAKPTRDGDRSRLVVTRVPSTCEPVVVTRSDSKTGT